MHDRNRQGNYAMVVGLSTTVIFGFAALAIDFTYLTVASLEIRAAADAGAHAAVIELRAGGTLDDAREAARLVIEEHRIAEADARVDPNTDIEFGRWSFENSTWTDNNETPNAVRVNVRRESGSVGGPIPLLLAPIFGTDFADAGIQAQSTAALRTRDILVVQDITGSFKDEILQARIADLALLNHLQENSFEGDRLGLVVFTAGSRLEEPLQDVPSNYTNLFATFNALDWCSELTTTKLQCRTSTTSAWLANGWYDANGPAGGFDNARNWYDNTRTRAQCPGNGTSSSTRVRTVAANSANDRAANGGLNGPANRRLRAHMPDCNADPDIGSGGGTDQGAGLERAIDHLLAESEPTSLRVIVLVSDGEPYCSSSSCKTNRRNHGINQAARAEAENISIYSVSFNEADSDVQRDYLRGLTTGYGKFYDTPDETELPAILADIARSIPVSLVH